MIVANLATYPARRRRLAAAVAAIAPQVDRLNIVLNEYTEVPAELPRLPNVVPILPEDDMKDVGKFYPDVSDADYVFLVDDDLNYPATYVQTSLQFLQRLEDDGVVCGYHGTVYRKPRFKAELRELTGFFIRRKRDILKYKDSYGFMNHQDVPVYVDKMGTGTAYFPARLMPPFEFMQDAKNFVDVRFSLWCFLNDIPRVCMPHAADWLTEDKFEERIWRTYTRKRPLALALEVEQFAYKDPRVGSVPELVRPLA